MNIDGLSVTIYTSAIEGIITSSTNVQQVTVTVLADTAAVVSQRRTRLWNR